MEGLDVECVIECFVCEGCNIIFIMFFGYMNLIIKVVKKFLDVKFEYVIGYKIVDNVVIYNFKFYEGCYIIG